MTKKRSAPKIDTENEKGGAVKKEMTVNGITFAIETSPRKLVIVDQYNGEKSYVGEYRIEGWDCEKIKDVEAEVRNIIKVQS